MNLTTLPINLEKLRLLHSLRIMPKMNKFNLNSKQIQNIYTNLLFLPLYNAIRSTLSTHTSPHS
jgi:hypothetical protein